MENMYDLNGNYRFLPKIFRDFHQQKDLFKSIYSMTNYDKRDVPDYYKINWVAFHTNVIDVFLFQMALRGYTLQKDCRFKIYDNPIMKIKSANLTF